MKKDNRKFKNEKGTDEYFWEVLNEQKINTLTKWCLQKYSTIYNEEDARDVVMSNILDVYKQYTKNIKVSDNLAGYLVTTISMYMLRVAQHKGHTYGISPSNQMVTKDIMYKDKEGVISFDNEAEKAYIENSKPTYDPALDLRSRIVFDSLLNFIDKERGPYHSFIWRMKWLNNYTYKKLEELTKIKEKALRNSISESKDLILDSVKYKDLLKLKEWTEEQEYKEKYDRD